MKLSDKFTFVRIIFAPIFVLLYFIPIWLKSTQINPENLKIIATVFMFIAIPLLLFAEFTDYLDGHYARKHN